MSAPEFVDIFFGPYRPDLGGAPMADMPGYLVDAIGVRPTPNGYRGLPTFSDVTSAAAIGGATTFWQAAYVESATTRNFFAFNVTDAKIYESVDDGQTWADTTPAAGAALTFPGRFFTYENDVIFVCESRAAIKRLIAAAAGTDFSNLGGSPPIATCGAQVRQHVVLGCLIGVDNYAVQWSAIGDHEDWPTPGSADAISKQSGREVLPHKLGIVKEVAGGEKFGLVWQQNGITRMTYQGGEEVYAFDTFESEIGLGYLTNSFVTSDGRLWYWTNDHGVFATDGYSVDLLDAGKIEDSIYNDLVGHPNADTLWANPASAVYDPHRHLVLFGNHESDYQLAYDVPSREFVFMNETNVAAMCQGRMGSPTTNATRGNTVHNINQSSRKLQRLAGTGSGSTVAMQTGYVELAPGRRVNLVKAHLIGSGVPVGTNPTALSIAYKSAETYISCDLSQSGFTTFTSEARGMGYTARAAGQFFAFRVTGTGTETMLARGLRVYFTPAEPSL